MKKQDELTFKNSPFYVEYTEKAVDKSFKMPKDMLKALEKHLKEKHADEVENDIGNKFRFGKYIRITLEDYLQHQCLERKMFGKSIYALVSEDKLKEDKNNTNIAVLFVTNPSLYYTTKKFDEQDLLFYQVHKVDLADFPYNKMMFGKKLENKFLKELKDYQDCYASENIKVLEIQLNNYLDVYHDGIYSASANNFYDHIGANIIPTTDGSFGLIYHWFVNQNYQIEVALMQVVSQESLLSYFRTCHNDKMEVAYASYFKHHNKNFPKLESELIKARLKRKLNIKHDLEDEIANLRQQLDKLEDH